MILADSAILNEMDLGNIVVLPFDPHALGSNSYDVHLSNKLKVYLGMTQHSHMAAVGTHVPGAINAWSSPILDSRKENPTADLIISGDGFVLMPGVLYLGSTQEFTKTKNLVPYLEGKSSIGRLGIKVHVTAGKGDIGFEGHWTLEIEVTHPIRVYPGMAIAQLSYFRPEGFCINPYNIKPGAKYNNDSDEPMPSQPTVYSSGSKANFFNNIDLLERHRELMGDSGVAGHQDFDDEA